jgi:hypothetical protein
VSDLTEPDDAPAAEPWVHGIYEEWERTYGLEVLVDGVANQLPIDEYLWHLVGGLRQAVLEAGIRVASRFPDDLQWLAAEVSRAGAVEGSLELFAVGLDQLFETVGVERMTEIGEKYAQRLGGAGADGAESAPS